MSFSARLLLTSLVTLAVGLGALVVLGNVLLDRRVTAEVSNELRVNAEAQLATLAISSNGITVREAPNDEALDRHAWVLDGDRVVERATNVSPELDRTAVALGRARAFGDHDTDGDIRLRVVGVHAPGRRGSAGAVVVALSTAPLENLQKQVLVGSLVIAALVLLAGALALRTAIDRALDPVVQMTTRAEDWGAHDLDRRFDLGPPRDELTGLATTLDGLLDRIAASRRHEQRFASEMAHELRTPVAGLRGRAELALGADGVAEKDEALRAVVAQSARLTETVDTLLAVARRELDPSGGVVDLVALAREVEGAEVVVPDTTLPLAEGEPDVLRRALAPLVANARAHARTRVTLELSAGGGRVRIAVRDDGPGLDPALGERAFDPG
ncbi:MAG TPA: histidine kinase dimerization/phospho-acceptor domain-containing protein, partial [Baekduia sp.]|nr:histidine kinase dimerization/phospho-acceptor domain-containing protein [Baekduia sp.]